ncbi:MAG: Spy/CpxP family protein refolding chaperone [Acidimicrobiales bacterium]
MRFAPLFILTVIATPLAAQHEHARPARSPYADLTGREIKALSADDVMRYRTGEGMGFALAAELNAYPGPKHVLELTSELELDPKVASRIRAIADSMRASAVALGERIVAAERELDRAFAGRAVDDGRVRAATAEIARLNGELRYTHLRAHLAVTALLTPRQVERYQVARGYRP